MPNFTIPARFDYRRALREKVQAAIDNSDSSCFTVRLGRKEYPEDAVRQIVRELREDDISVEIDYRTDAILINIKLWSG